jgi:hypothetical protein
MALKEREVINTYVQDKIAHMPMNEVHRKVLLRAAEPDKRIPSFSGDEFKAAEELVDLGLCGRCATAGTTYHVLTLAGRALVEKMQQGR